MRDEDKTKEQLIEELIELRQQLAEMGAPLPKREQVGVEEVAHEAEEPWLKIETKLITTCLIAGFIALIVLAILVNMFILRA
jgi:hypothetical protein